MRHRRLSLLAALGVVLLGVQPARAISFYAEILTNDNFPIFPDTTASATVTVDFDPLSFDWTGMTSGPDTGLGTGLVTTSTPLEYTHLFDPTPDSAAILQAWLVISVTDDLVPPIGDLVEPETASIELDGSFWQTGQATLNLFFGDITALGLITTDGDTIDVTVSSVTGDFQVLASALKVKFSEVPEPGTLLLVGLGTALLAVRRRAA